MHNYVYIFIIRLPSKNVCILLAYLSCNIHINVRVELRTYHQYNIFTHSGTASVTNTMATVAVDGLKCGVTYIIIAEGTLNGDLVGPRSSHGTIDTNPCPVCPVTGNIHYQINTYINVA